MPPRRFRRRSLIMLTIFALFLAPILARAALYAVSDDPRSWRDADWSSTGMLPKALDDKPARVIVFTGKAGAWKGVFAVHSWIVLKRANAPRGRATTWSAGAIRCAPTAGRRTAAGTATCRSRLPISPASRREKLIPRIEAAVKAYGYRASRRLPHLAGPEQQQLHRRDPARGAGTGRRRCRRTRSAAISATASMPAAPTAAPASNSICAALPTSRLGWVEGRRAQSAWAGGRARSAPSRPEAAGLRPHRR